MLKNFFHLIFLATAILPLNYQIKAMNSPIEKNKRSFHNIIESPLDLEQIFQEINNYTLEINCSEVSESINELLEGLIYQDFTEADNSTSKETTLKQEQNGSKKESVIFQDQATYRSKHQELEYQSNNLCKFLTKNGEVQNYSECCKFISLHCSFLERFYKNLKFLKITNGNLYDYKRLLYKLLDQQHPDLDLVLSTLNNYLELIETQYSEIENNPITLEEINTLLNLLLINNGFSTKKSSSEKAQNCLKKIIYSAFNGHEIYTHIELKNICANLCTLLIQNNLLPSLNYITIDGCTFFMLLVSYSQYNIKLLRDIINNEINKNYNWEELFSMQHNIDGNTVLHYAAIISKDVTQVILDFIKALNLNLAQFINKKNGKGETPIMVANMNGNIEIANLLTSYGAK